MVFFRPPLSKTTGKLKISTSIKQTMNKAAQELGKLGGNKTKLKGKKYYSNIGKLGAKKRWKDVRKLIEKV